MYDNLIAKYDVPAPRYTSYPTVPYWQREVPTVDAWMKSVKQVVAAGEPISLYIHLPFCEQLCTYCACNKRITKNHAVEQPYLEALLQEWDIYSKAIGYRPMVKTIHIGGGTPTFFSPDHLRAFLKRLLGMVHVAEDYEFSFEAHPNNTTKAHLKVLYQMGFRRISIGVQDVDATILSLINRQQTLEDVERVTQQARAIGYTSINFDLVFGLPTQTTQHIIRTMKVVKRLRPDRIAFYSYAHVPWKSPGQRAYSTIDLPMGTQKRALYELGKRLLQRMIYEEIGMDHFALPNDELSIAARTGQLHRNFMGYTDSYTPLMIGLGASSISDSWGMFVQNEKKVEDYQAAVATGTLPLIKGHELSEEDLFIREHILRLSCQFATSWSVEDEKLDCLQTALIKWSAMEQDGILELIDGGIQVTKTGRSFIRNICMALDARYWEKQTQQQVFSQAI
jgi:oxygen-independent coproporphyrinogen-3 oxidase